MLPKNLKKVKQHFAQNHAEKIKCDFCIQIFENKGEFEDHLEMMYDIALTGAKFYM